MATRLPSTGTTPAPSPQRSCDTADMRLVHGLLTLLFREAPALVADVAASRPRRQRAVVEHLAMISGILHGHHRTEDTLLWDTLETRMPSCAVHVGLMRSQHDEMARLLELLDARTADWSARGGADDGTVHDVLGDILEVMALHLGSEEELILPVAQVAMSQREWDLLGETSRQHTARGVMFVQLGYLIESLPTQGRDAWVRANLPWPLRAVWTLIGARRYARYRAELTVDA
jgi:iron-sulfur cluster repair protein YtfE (RIC family)